MVQKLISKAEFSRIAGVSGAAVTKACNKFLKPAMVGKRIDAGHTLSLEYLKKKGRSLPDDKAKPAYVRGAAAAKETKKREAAKDDQILEFPADIQSFADMTLRELIDRFGTDARFVDWLSATQKIEAINEKRLKNAATEGELVSRELIRVGIIEPIDACHIKLLTDGAKTIARRATAMHSAEKPLEDIEKFVKDQITSFIRPVKAKVARALKNA